jgi:outer membrane protein assembly factor BamD (BamD/ComL family)/thiol-disulfide isomerase/thioredoxin
MPETPDSRSVLSAPTITFAALVGLVCLGLGFMLGRSGAPTAPEPLVEVKNEAGGTLRKLDDKEKAELLARKKEAPEGAAAPPKDSPYLTDAIRASFGDDATALATYEAAVASMAQGNARKARAPLDTLMTTSVGKPWREQVAVLHADAQVAVGEIAEGRAALLQWKRDFPSSAHMADAVVAEGEASLKEARRGSKGGPLDAQQQAAFRAAIAVFDDVLARFPDHPACEDALLDKASALGELGDLEAGEAAAMQLAERFPTSPRAARALASVGKVALDKEDHDRARRLYKRLVESFPTDRLAAQGRAALESLELLGQVAPELAVAEWIGPVGKTIADSRGKPVLLVFWATWCPHCRKEMPRLEADIWKKYKEKGLQVVAVTRHSRGQTNEKVVEYRDENSITMPIAVDSGTTSRAYGVSGIPAAALIDKDGKIAFRGHPAQVSEEMLKRVL